MLRNNYFRFSPDRFTEKHATAFMPFGLGGRKCIGSRLAMIEMKLTVILTLKEFVIKTCADTPVSFTFQIRGSIATTYSYLVLVLLM